MQLPAGYLHRVTHDFFIAYTRYRPFSLTRTLYKQHSGMEMEYRCNKKIINYSKTYRQADLFGGGPFMVDTSSWWIKDFSSRYQIQMKFSNSYHHNIL